MRSFSTSKASFAISIAHIFGVFGIVATNCFSMFQGKWSPGLYDRLVATGPAQYAYISGSGFADAAMFLASISGYWAVYFFFMISGFSLTYSNRMKGQFILKEYLAHRFIRIYLPYVFVAVLCFLLALVFRRYEPGEYDLLALLLGAAKSVRTAYDINPPLWFMGPLLVCYLVFPVFIRLNAKRTTIWVPLFLAGVVVGDSYWPETFALLYPLFQTTYFLLGALFFGIFFRLQKSVSPSASRLVGLGCGLTSVAFWVVELSNAKNGMSLTRHFWLYGTLNFVTILTLAYGLAPRSQKWIGRAEFISRGTFLIFLVHYPCARLWAKYTCFGPGVSTFVFFATSLVACAWVQCYFDRLMHWGSKKLGSFAISRSMQ